MEQENARLRKLLAEAGISERRACRLVGLSQITLRYQAVEYAANELLAERIVTLAHSRRRFGYRRIHAMLMFPYPDTM